MVWHHCCISYTPLAPLTISYQLRIINRWRLKDIAIPYKSTRKPSCDVTNDKKKISSNPKMFPKCVLCGDYIDLCMIPCISGLSCSFPKVSYCIASQKSHIIAIVFWTSLQKHNYSYVPYIVIVVQLYVWYQNKSLILATSCLVASYTYRTCV